LAISICNVETRLTCLGHLGRRETDRIILMAHCGFENKQN
jgi:hypothetical protein